MVRRPVRAFSLLDVAVILAGATVLAALLTAMAGQASRDTRTRLCESNLKQLGTACASYSADFQQRFPAFSWTAQDGRGDGDPAFVPPYRDELTGAARQALWIIRMRAERTDIQPIDGWLPHALYAHLLLHDYVASRLPDPWQACTEDSAMLRWHAAVQGPLVKLPPGHKAEYGHVRPALEARAALLALSATQRPTDLDDNAVQRIPYSASYALVSAAYSPDRREGDVRTVQSALTNHYTFTTNKARLGRRTMDEVAFPSRKVLMYDRFSRHFGKRELWHAYADAKQPLLFADNSVRVERTGDASPGAYPNARDSKLPLRYWYVPRAWEASTPSGKDKELVTGYYAWTRGGLKGLDFQ